MKIAAKALACAAFLSAFRLAAESTDVGADANGNATIDVVVELSDAGRKISRPTPQHPAYYVPVAAGYDPGNQPTFWQRPAPSADQVFKPFMRVLADQGYLMAARANPPSLLLVISWGYVEPRPATPGAFMRYIGRRPARPIAIPMHALANSQEMLTLTGGSRALAAWNETDRGSALNEAVVAAGVPRYFTKVVALDFAGWKRHQYTVLWVARLSVPYWGCYLDEAVPALLQAGAPMFGRDMSGPQMIKGSILPAGRVEVGAPVLLPLSPASTPTAAKSMP